MSVLALTAAIGITATLTFDLMSSRQRVSQQVKSVIEDRALLSGFIDYIKYAIQERWCVRRDDLSRIVPPPNDPGCSWQEDGNLKRLLLRAEAAQQLSEVPANGVVTALDEFAGNIQLSSLPSNHPLKGLAESSPDLVSLSYSVTRFRQSSDVPEALESKLKIEVTATSAGARLILNRPESISAYGVFAFYPREINQFALISQGRIVMDPNIAVDPLQGDLRMPTFSAGEANGRGLLSFKSPVFVNDHIVLNASTQHAARVAFEDSVVVGGGKLMAPTGNARTDVQPFLENQQIGRNLSSLSQLTQRTRFGGFAAGVTYESSVDEGLFHLFSCGANQSERRLREACINWRSMRGEASRTESSRLYTKLIHNSLDADGVRRFESEVGLTGGNSFIESTTRLVDTFTYNKTNLPNWMFAQGTTGQAGSFPFHSRLQGPFDPMLPGVAAPAPVPLGAGPAPSYAAPVTRNAILKFRIFAGLDRTNWTGPYVQGNQPQNSTVFELGSGLLSRDSEHTDIFLPVASSTAAVFRDDTTNEVRDRYNEFSSPNRIPISGLSAQGRNFMNNFRQGSLYADLPTEFRDLPFEDDSSSLNRDRFRIERTDPIHVSITKATNRVGRLERVIAILSAIWQEEFLPANGGGPASQSALGNVVLAAANAKDACGILRRTSFSGPGGTTITATPVRMSVCARLGRWFIDPSVDPGPLGQRLSAARGGGQPWYQRQSLDSSPFEFSSHLSPGGRSDCDPTIPQPELSTCVQARNQLSSYEDSNSTFAKSESLILRLRAITGSAGSWNLPGPSTPTIDSVLTALQAKRAQRLSDLNLLLAAFRDFDDPTHPIVADPAVNPSNAAQYMARIRIKTEPITVTPQNGNPSFIASDRVKFTVEVLNPSKFQLGWFDVRLEAFDVASENGEPREMGLTGSGPNRPFYIPRAADVSRRPGDANSNSSSRAAIRFFGKYRRIVESNELPDVYSNAKLSRHSGIESWVGSGAVPPPATPTNVVDSLNIAYSGNPNVDCHPRSGAPNYTRYFQCAANAGYFYPEAAVPPTDDVAYRILDDQVTRPNLPNGEFAWNFVLPSGNQQAGATGCGLQRASEWPGYRPNGINEDYINPIDLETLPACQTGATGGLAYGVSDGTNWASHSATSWNFSPPMCRYTELIAYGTDPNTGQTIYRPVQRERMCDSIVVQRGATDAPNYRLVHPTIPGQAYNPGNLSLAGFSVGDNVRVSKRATETVAIPAQTYLSASIATNCVIRNNVEFVAGLFVCTNFIIEGSRTFPLKIVGTVITQNLRVGTNAIRMHSPPATEPDIAFYSIWHPEAGVLLRTRQNVPQPSALPGVLTRSNGQACPALPQALAPLRATVPGGAFPADRVNLARCHESWIRSMVNATTWNQVTPTMGPCPNNPGAMCSLVQFMSNRYLPAVTLMRTDSL